MKKIHFLLLISLLLAACSDDDKEKQPAFVTNITISDAGKTFNPGDAVTVKADGLQSGDQIILDIYWPIADNPLFPEGYSRYTRAVTTEQTTNSITFLAPGHWPASRVEMFLERAGQLQPLGQISVADGQSHEEPYLYGITNSHAIYTPTVPRGITRIDLVTQEISEVIQFHDGEDFCLAANIPGTNAINRANKLNGELLLIHGTADDNVHLRNNAEYSEALVQADKQFDMQIYTNRNHGISGGNTTKHLLTRVANFFIDNLK